MNDFRIHTLPNGLRVVSIHLPSTSTVSLLVLFGVGSEYETKELNGISHFYEHMVFKGTTSRPKPWDVAGALESLGGISNAFTSETCVGYWIKVASRFTEEASEIVSDILLHPLFDEQEIEGERGPVIEELKRVFDSPTSHLAMVWQELLYGDQPAGWEIGGTPENVSRFSRADLIAQVEKFYTASNTVLVYAGNTSHEEALHLAQKYFIDLHRGSPPPKPPVVIDQSSPRMKLVRKDLEQVNLVVGFHSYDVFHLDRYASDLLGMILGGGMSSRLFVEVREKAGLAYFIATQGEHLLDHGEFGSVTGVRREKLIKALRIILREHTRVASDVTEEELVWAKRMMRGQFEITLEDSRKVADFYGEKVLIHNRVIPPAEEIQRLEAVTLDDIRRVANDLFRRERLNLAVLGPVNDKDEERINELIGTF